MMDVCEAWLEENRAALQPTKAQVAAASRSQNHLRDVLSDGRFGGRILRTFLQGSYARDTAIQPVDDVDIVLVVDPTAWPMKRWQSRPAPEAVIASFAGAIRYRYPNSGVRQQRRSVCLEMEHLAVDVVPAIEAGQREGIVLVPDRVDDQWIPSSPTHHEAYVHAVNKRTQGLAVQLVKLLKGWNSALSDNARIRSFALEVGAVRFLEVNRVTSLVDGLASLWDFFAAVAGAHRSKCTWPVGVQAMNFFGTPTIDDPAGLGGNVAAGLQQEKWDLFGAKCLAALNHLDGALRARGEESARRHLAGIPF